MKTRCPKCGSKNIDHIKYNNEDVISCNHCNYEETEDSTEITQKTNQKQKGKYNIYKSRLS